jgi:seryl-tRNA synthetase
MIDLQDLRARPDAYKAACEAKRIAFSIDDFLKLDEEYRAALARFEKARAEQNKLSKALPTLQGEEKQASLASMKELSGAVKDLASQLRDLEQCWVEGHLRIPSIPDSEVPPGKDDTENVELRTWGVLPAAEDTPDDHVSIGQRLGILDLERGVKVAGARNYFLCGDGARLQHAVHSFAMDVLYEKGYRLMDPPQIVLKEAMTGTGYFPGGEEQAFHLDDRDKDHYLVGTSEVPVCAFHMGEILEEQELPKRYAGYSTCYRREAGSYGKDTHGLYRVHQFQKVEQVVICKADREESARMHRELLDNAEVLLQALELPYRVVTVCAGDMGQGQVLKHDIECWMPSRKSYGETHSCSTFLDFQARRLKLRYKDADGNNVFCHTLNNTLVATPRILIALLEVHQTRDGKVRVPEALQPYMGGQEFIG